MEGRTMAKTVKYKDVAVNSLFSYSGVEYKKIEEVRVSCCKRVNAELVSDSAIRVRVEQEADVTIND